MSAQARATPSSPATRSPSALARSRIAWSGLAARVASLRTYARNPRATRRSVSRVSFRDEVDAARARADALRARIADGDGEAASELAGLEASIDAARGRALKVLSEVRVATPCPASWAAMVGGDRVRRCALCEKNVYDLSGLTAREAVHLLAREGDACVRLHRRRDGTLITADCEVGRRRRRKRWLAGAAATLAIGGTVSLAAAHEEPPRVQAQPLAEPERVFDEEVFRDGATVIDRRVLEEAGPPEPVACWISLHQMLRQRLGETVVMGEVAPRIADGEDLERER